MPEVHEVTEARMISGSCHCGAVHWEFDGVPEGATACNCTLCRRYGVLWAYDYENEGIRVSGETTAYVRGEEIEFHFCPVCGCVAFWRARQKDQQGRRRIAVNLRLAEPEAVGRVHQRTQIVAAAVAAGGSEEGHAVVPPVPVTGKVRDGHQLYGRHAKVAQVGEPAGGGPEGALRCEGADV